MNLAQFGMSTPVVTLSGANRNAWEKTGTIDDIAAVGRAADRLGFDHLRCAEHVIVTPEQEARRGGRYFDPLATFGYLAAVTSRIRFVTGVLVLAYHHPLEIAKRYGTLDVVSGGRLVLGLGVGSLKAEFDLLGLGGAEFTERGPRGDDALRALRASIGRREPEYHGRYYDYGDVIVDPCALQQDMPFWIGGRSLLSLRRAIDLGEGWMPFGLGADEIASMMAKAKGLPGWAARTRPLEIVLNTDAPLDPLGDPDGTLKAARDIFALGATRCSVTFKSDNAAHHIEQMEAMAALIGGKGD